MLYYHSANNDIHLQISLLQARQCRTLEDLAEIRRIPYIKCQLDAVDETLLREELSSHTWVDADVADHDKNLSRLLWNACHIIAEENRAR